MALEALGATSGAASLASLGLTACNGLLKYYKSWKDAEKDVKLMYSSVETLGKTFVALRNTLGRPALDAHLVHEVEECILLCEHGIGCLQKKLKKITMNTQSKDVGWNAKIQRKLQRACYPFKESTLVKLKEVSNEMMDHLRLALEILQLDTSAVSLELMLDQADRSDDILTGIHGVAIDVSHTLSGVTELASLQQDQQSSTVFEWLSPLFGEFADKQHETFNIRARQDRNGHWLVGSSEFKRWAQGGGQLLWCLGSRGVGKTVLASFVINHLQTNKPSASGMAYIYGNYNDVRQKNVSNLIGVVLQQLATQNGSCMDELKRWYENHREARTRPSLQEYGELLRNIIAPFANIFVVIDALDEYDEETRDALLIEFGRFGTDISLLITSRHSIVSTQWSQAETRLSLTASEDDIKGYLEERLHQSQGLRRHIVKDHSLHNHVVSSIMRKAKGMFLLARMQLDLLMAKPTLRKIKSALDSLPEELDAMYDQVLERIRAQNPEYAALGLKIICWVYHATKSLSVRDIRHALAVEIGDRSFDQEGLPDEELLEPVCAGLVTIQEHRTIGLVHYTAQEYLARRFLTIFPDSNRFVAETCLTYLSFEDFNLGPCQSKAALEARLDEYPLLIYVAENWARYLDKKTQIDTEEQILGFLAQESKVESSVQAMQAIKSPLRTFSGYQRASISDCRYTKNINGLHLCSMYGLQHIARKLIAQGADVSSTDSEGYTPLHYAAAYGSFEVVPLLLDEAADLEARTGYLWHTALHSAAWHGRQDVFQQLLGKGANAAARDRLGYLILHLAALNGHLQLVRLLLEGGGDINVRGSRGRTPLICAVGEGRAKTTQYLLDNGADINLADNFRQTPLHYAVMRNRPEIARLLVERGADSTLTDFRGRNPGSSPAAMYRDMAAVLWSEYEQANKFSKDALPQARTGTLGSDEL